MLPDYLRENLDAVFVGTSVATASASRGHYYSGPGNKFWHLLWDAGLTGDRLLIPEQDSMLLEYRMGLTDLVKGRASSSDAGLRSSDYDVAAFIGKIAEFTPFAVAFNGREAAKRVSRALGQGDPSLGLQEWNIEASRIYVLPSSSGSSADPRHFAPKRAKGEWWIEFGSWLQHARHRA